MNNATTRRSAAVALHLAADRLLASWPAEVARALPVLTQAAQHASTCPRRTHQADDLTALVAMLGGDYDPSLADITAAAVELADELRHHPIVGPSCARPMQLVGDP